MRLQIFSDLHADVTQPRLITVAPDVDVAIVAGDVCEGAESGFAHLRLIVPMHVPIIMVMGNHEYYRRHLATELETARQAAPLYGVHLLENDVVTLCGVRFIGCSLWTDYALFSDPQRAMLVAAHGLNDHRLVKTAVVSLSPARSLAPASTVARLHRGSAKPLDGGKLVDAFASTSLEKHV